MPSTQDEQAKLEAAIAAQERVRSIVGDELADLTIAALRDRLDALRSGPPDTPLARLHSYLPRELADKIRASGHLEGERKQVTVLFADVSGFTSLSERLDPEEVTALTNEVLRELAEAIYQHEGYVDKFIGDAVMAVFGAPVAHEDDPERALRSALAMRERQERLGRRWQEKLGQSLPLHIGIHTGTVIAGNIGPDLRLSYTVMGDTVNTASRLEAAAGPGQILLSHETWRLTREAFVSDALEPIRVKGKAEPLPVYELRRARLLPGKGRGLGELASAFVGREHEMAALASVAEDLRAGRGRLLAVTGEAGAGKSRLLAEWRATLGVSVHWLEGRCYAHTSSHAYGPFLDLLRRHAGITGEMSDADARSRLDASLGPRGLEDPDAAPLFASLLGARLSPEESRRLAALPAESLRKRLADLFLDFYSRLALDRPALLVIEDAQWADATSLELGTHLLPLAARLPFGLVAVFRRQKAAHAEQAAALLAAARSQVPPGLTELALGPLSEEASAEMVRRLLSLEELPPELVRLVLGKAEGNPFFIEELIRALIERGALVPEGPHGPWRRSALLGSVNVPDTLEGLLMARLDRLPAETRWLAQEASVIGRVFLYDVLSRIAENGSTLEADLGHLERSRLVRLRSREPELEYVFKHALTQEVAYQSLLVQRRKDIHRKVGHAMAELYRDRIGALDSVVGEHFLRGEAWAEAFEHLRRAGDAAARLYAHTEARDCYGKAIIALAHLPETDTTRRQRVEALLALVGVSFGVDPEQNRTRLAEAEQLARSLPGADGEPGGDRALLARVAFWRGRVHWYQNEHRRAVDDFLEVLAAGEASGDEELLALASNLIGRVMLFQGQFRQTLPFFLRAVEPLERGGDVTEAIVNAGFLGAALAATGQVAEGLAQIERGLARALQVGHLMGIAISRVFRAFVHLLAGDPAQALEEALQAKAAAERSGDRVYTYAAAGLEAWAQSRLGRHAEAASSLTRLEEIGKSLGGRVFLADVFAAVQAEAALNAGRPEEARRVAEATAQAAEASGSLLAGGLARRVLGEALAAEPSRVAEAEAQLVESLRLLEAGDARLEAARTHLAWSGVCLARKDAAGAQQHAEAAAAAFEASGLAVEAERARALRESKIRSAFSPPAPP
jgi:class 3 adenylate cyclase